MVSSRRERALRAWICLTVGNAYCFFNGIKAYNIAKILGKPVSVIQKNLHGIVGEKLPLIEKKGALYFPTGETLPWLLSQGMIQIGEDLLLRGDADTMRDRLSRIGSARAAWASI